MSECVFVFWSGKTHRQDIRCNIFCRGHGTNQNEIKNNDHSVSLVLSMPMLNTHSSFTRSSIYVCHNEPKEKNEREKKINKWNWNKMSNALVLHTRLLGSVMREEICAIHFRLMCVSECECVSDDFCELLKDVCECKCVWQWKWWIICQANKFHFCSLSWTYKIWLWPSASHSRYLSISCECVRVCL